MTRPSPSTMAPTSKYLVFFILFVTLINRSSSGSSSCSQGSINIDTTITGRVISGKPEWSVYVVNNCSCAQYRIRLSCKGFQTAEAVNPLILSKQGATCLLINGNPLKGFAGVRFSYAWYPPHVFFLSSSKIGDCS